MDPKVVTAIIIGLAVLVIAVLLIARSRRRSMHLREQFGPEYERALLQHRDSSKAEAMLADRETRVQKLAIRQLPVTESAAYADEWAVVQRRFVDDPSIAVSEADRLVNRVMNACGYPTGDYDQRAADISVNHPAVVQNYRQARNIFVRHSGGRATTEDLRQAMVYYRSLVDELLAEPISPVLLRRAS